MEKWNTCKTSNGDLMTWSVVGKTQNRLIDCYCKSSASQHRLQSPSKQPPNTVALK